MSHTICKSCSLSFSFQVHHELLKLLSLLTFGHVLTSLYSSWKRKLGCDSDVGPWWMQSGNLMKTKIFGQPVPRQIQELCRAVKSSLVQRSDGQHQAPEGSPFSPVQQWGQQAHWTAEPQGFSAFMALTHHVLFIPPGRTSSSVPACSVRATARHNPEAPHLEPRRTWCIPGRPSQQIHGQNMDLLVVIYSSWHLNSSQDFTRENLTNHTSQLSQVFLFISSPVQHQKPQTRCWFHQHCRAPRYILYLWSSHELSSLLSAIEEHDQELHDKAWGSANHSCFLWCIHDSYWLDRQNTHLFQTYLHEMMMLEVESDCYKWTSLLLRWYHERAWLVKAKRHRSFHEKQVLSKTMKECKQKQDKTGNTHKNGCFTVATEDPNFIHLLVQPWMKSIHSFTASQPSMVQLLFAIKISLDFQSIP